jgi:ubiquinone/menaquinone biosynthesis C-methylase UbiE
MPDKLFADPRLARIYDLFDNDRRDLDHYIDLLAELEVSSVLDIGCGTGCLALLLADRGLTVTGVDPAAASLDVARSKPGSDRVEWVDGDATTVPVRNVDAAIMTGNVAQVFTTDKAWADTLQAAAEAIRPGGYLVFEVRDPARRVWVEWTKQHTTKRIDVPGAGPVTHWVEVTDISLPLVSFESHYHFEKDNERLLSNSTLRFRERDEVETTLKAAGFSVEEVRGAPDRPGKEMVFISRRNGGN